MALNLFNSMGRQVAPFVPQDAGHVRMYVCGPTVYSYAHIGNARPAVVFDLLARRLRTAGLRVETDLRNEKIGYKVRDHALAKVPVQIALGAREADELTVTIRRYGATQTLPLSEAITALVRDAQPPGRM
ncbi:His/Gly/Thr/Pro-type tRNA ligase C-terminal domain-containing protein [Roseinatronobacter sp. NSM]|uniref:His/Gly/Thr/Pro-type tRNA ligase C-terminal domain-containing protein n=1 Tax=Roseinatronobacter sp. NSM TaxID=3457785 RepID=UPI004036E1F1